MSKKTPKTNEQEHKKTKYDLKMEARSKADHFYHFPYRLHHPAGSDRPYRRIFQCQHDRGYCKCQQ